MPFKALDLLQQDINKGSHSLRQTVRRQIRQNDDSEKEIDNMKKSKKSKANAKTTSVASTSTSIPVVSHIQANSTNTVAMATGNSTPGGSNPIPPRANFSVTATLPPHNLKFAGNVPKDDPDYEQLIVYNVDQFLIDLDTRIQTLGITADEAKIQEAQIFVNREKGDARWILVDPVFKKIKNYQEFKSKCREIYEPKEATDKFYNLTRLRTVSPKLNGNMYSRELATAVDYVIRDIEKNQNMTKAIGTNGNTMVDLEEIIKYVAYGTLHDNSRKEYRDALRRLDLDPKEDIHRTYTRMKEEMRKESNDDIDFVGVTQHIVQSGSSPPSSQHTRGKQIQGPFNTVQRGQGQYRGSTQRGRVYHNNQGRAYSNSSYNSNYNQGNTYGHSNYNQGYSHSRVNSFDQGNTHGNSRRQNFRGRGYQNQGNRGRAHCRRCNRNNHDTSECIMCGYCQRYGHYDSQCRFKQNDQGQGNYYNN